MFIIYHLKKYFDMVAGITDNYFTTFSFVFLLVSVLVPMNPVHDIPKKVSRFSVHSLTQNHIF